MTVRSTSITEPSLRSARSRLRAATLLGAAVLGLLPTSACSRRDPEIVEAIVHDGRVLAVSRGGSPTNGRGSLFTVRSVEDPANVLHAISRTDLQPMFARRYVEGQDLDGYHDHAYVAVGGGLLVVNIAADPPKPVAETQLQGMTDVLQVVDGRLYVGQGSTPDSGPKVLIFEIEKDGALPANHREVELPSTGRPGVTIEGVARHGGAVYAATSVALWRSAEGPAGQGPAEKVLDLEHPPLALAQLGDDLLLAERGGGIAVLRLTGAKPTLRRLTNPAIQRTWFRAIAMVPGHVVLTDLEGGVIVFNSLADLERDSGRRYEGDPVVGVAEAEGRGKLIVSRDGGDALSLVDLPGD